MPKIHKRNVFWMQDVSTIIWPWWKAENLPTWILSPLCFCKKEGRADTENISTVWKHCGRKEYHSTTSHMNYSFPLEPCLASSWSLFLYQYLIKKTKNKQNRSIRLAGKNEWVCLALEERKTLLPGIVLSRMKPKNPPINMCVVKSTTITWSNSFNPWNVKQNI